MSDKKKIEDEKISRGEFFGVAVNKGKEITFGWVEKFLAPITKLSEELTETTEKGSWFEVAMEDEINKIPRMVLKMGKGFFIFKDDEKRIRGVWGMCPEDGFAMNYFANEDGLYCANCQVVYHLIRGSSLEDGKRYVREVPLKVENNRVYIFLED